MSEEKQHGRRRANVSTPGVLTPVHGARRAALAAERSQGRQESSVAHLVRASVANGAGQKVGLVLAVTGLALAVTVPSAAVESANGTELAAGVSQIEASAPITADANGKVRLATPSLESVLTLDGKLTQTLKVNAAKVSAAAAKGTLSPPVKKMVRSSQFGVRINPLTGAAGEFHEGEDFAGACGSDVLAAAEGVVTFAQWHQYGGGNRIVVSHGNGLSTSYNHLTSMGVKVGQKVSRGELIAQSGTTGNSTGCHLHFEVIVDDEKVNPEGWL